MTRLVRFLDPRHVPLHRMAAWFPILLLAGLAGLATWLDSQVQASRPDPSTMRHDPDWFIAGFTAVDYGPNGEITRRLTAKKMTHYPDDNTSELTEPQFESRSPDKPTVTIRASRGTASGDRENLYFNGAVKMIREPLPAQAARGPLTLQTDYLHVLPNLEQMRTDRPVRIADSQSTITAVGLDLDHKTHIMRLRSRVHAEIMPPRRTAP